MAVPQASLSKQQSDSVVRKSRLVLASYHFLGNSSEFCVIITIVCVSVLHPVLPLIISLCFLKDFVWLERTSLPLRIK